MSASRHTVGRWIVDSADRRPDHPAIDDRGVVLTYSEVAGRALALSALLSDAGYGAGHRIATVSGTSADHVVAFFAAALSGITFAPLSVRLTPGELCSLLARTAPALVLVDEEHEPLLAGVQEHGRLAIPTAALGTQGVESHVPPSGEPRAPRPAEDTDPALLIYTSGAEAEPKGVLLSHEACFWTNHSLDQAMPLHEDDVVLCTLPQYHVAAWNVQPLLAWRTGATVVLERGFSPSRVLSLLETRGVTVMMGVPTQYRLLSDEPGWADADLSTLRLAVAGGSPLAPEVAAAWRSRGAALTPGYGLTEAGPNTLHLPAAQAEHTPGSVGVPYPHVEVQLRDPESGLVLDGPATGELWVSSASLFSGYLDDEPATAQALHGGWLRTGDLASRDRDGRYAIIDRLKDIFISGGENVAPAEVERALEAHPLVARAAVVGVPDDVWGERGVAYVRPVAGAFLGVDELVSHARATLAGFKVPVRFTVVDDLPLGTLDKVARRVLRDHAVSDRRAR